MIRLQQLWPKSSLSVLLSFTNITNASAGCISSVKFKRAYTYSLTTTKAMATTTTTTDKAKPKVFVTRSDYPQVAIDYLQKSCQLSFWNNPSRIPKEFLLESVQEGVDGIFCCITDPINAELLEKAGPRLKVIGTMSVGYDHIDTKACQAKGIKIGYTPDVLTDATAELTVAVLLAASRRLFESHQTILNDNWSKSFWGPTFMCGMGLAGATVGIFGLGRIGQAVMARLAPFNVKRFIYSGRTKKNDAAGAEFVDFDTLLTQSDFIIVTCPLTPATKEIFNERAFSLMKSNAVFVNSSRGGLVQQDALISALKSRKIFGAGLDVMSPEPLPPNHELMKLDNCVVVPHIGSATIQSRNEMAMLTAKNILAAIRGEKMPCELVL